MNTEKQIIKWGILEYGQWQLYVATTEKGLCYIGSPGQSFEELKAWMQKRFPYASLIVNEEALMPYINELQEYFEGTRQSFSLRIDVKGTPFQEEIWEALKQIPYGKTCSYSDIASLVQRPAAVRAVGTAIGANPVLITVPCHRVIGKNGAITGYRGGTEMKQYLLQLESQNGGMPNA
ncbi:MULTISPECIES: methylated-DNA--[protein]-cysteine S-methyltransferase [Metabacillus]|uniref:Methylated-DNA--[protein]-cysteine S-methyltransferase n=1 Tax=Metabacillus hrfriensis TaxID=3048891 RepID=A0ACD4R5G5_9BACI|nr:MULTISPECIES: methylated-DNA--[protein]-cysteine S-methyltransferase [Metabacillus]UAL50209.1 methylated-DNA--[protein]-cysteine S-methyltransferase [Metabacillus dongyingensis]UOK56324.1 methylated-DNA--[protein]-cysteine S-methyltransferase [Bacillus sp. OVS6]USK26451.1 methylated-DNA--[protein]-cysteine S-methyltransferase [Bacillus sp. CMF21]WHZ55676.1 methylated-DNA--[protein]-cysteine S-methyltransferase [Metabacillus sp. CT-WN-B3]